jgi:hypothetical protein
MDSAEARKYLSGELSFNDISQTSETGGNPDPSSTGNPTTGDGGNDTQLEQPSTEGAEDSRTATADDSNPNPNGGEGEGAEDNSNPKPNDDPNQSTATEEGQSEFLEGKKDKRLPYPNAKSNSKNPKDLAKIKANEAFIRQKHKYKARVADLESQISNLKAQLMKYNAVNQENLKDDVDKLTDLKIAKGLVQNQINGLEAQKNSVLEDEAEMQANQIHEQRVAACFSDEAEIEHYHTLLENGRDKFINFLNKVDPDQTVLQYLDDCDISPLMVRVLMTNPQVLRKVVEKTNPMSKMFELRALESRIGLDMKLRQVKTNKSPNNQSKKLPSTGSQISSGGGKTQTEVRDANYWRNYLATHN